MSIYKSNETERVARQTHDEWLDECEGISCGINTTAKTFNIKSEQENEKQNQISDRLKNSGFESIRFAGDQLVIKANKYIPKEIKNEIQSYTQDLANFAEADTGESLYLYTGYRTFMSNNRPFIAIEFTEIHTGQIAERYFNIELRNKTGKSFKTGRNGKFCIIGNSKRPMKRSFIKTWMEAIKTIPENRPSHICRYMNSMLAGAVFSCHNPVLHHDITKLKDIRFEGFLYEIN